MVEMSKREAIIEVVNRLFVFTDTQQWEKLLKEVFATEVMFDMSSVAGGPARKVAPGEICDLWREGFKGIDSIHHQAGNYIVTIKEEVNAEVLCYAIAAHFRKDAKKGNVREFVGSYNIILVFTDVGWRINGFRYNLKYITGNSSLD
jgi:hypothetical protein